MSYHMVLYCVSYRVVEYFCPHQKLMNWTSHNQTKPTSFRAAFRYIQIHVILYIRSIFGHMCVEYTAQSTQIHCQLNLRPPKNTHNVCVFQSQKKHTYSFVLLCYKYSISCDSALFSFQNRSNSCVHILFGYSYIWYHGHSYPPSIHFNRMGFHRFWLLNGEYIQNIHK